MELVSAPGFFDALAEKTLGLVEGFREGAIHAGIPFAANAVGGMFGLFFTERESVGSFAEVMACDAERFKRFFHGMLEEGVYLAPSAFEAGFVSAAHDEAVIEATLRAAEKVFARL